MGLPPSLPPPLAPSLAPMSPMSPVSHYQCLPSQPQPLLPLQVPGQYGPGQPLQDQPGLSTEQLGQLAIASLQAGGGKKRPRESGDELLLVSITSFSSGVIPPNSSADWLLAWLLGSLAELLC